MENTQIMVIIIAVLAIVYLCYEPKKKKQKESKHNIELIAGLYKGYTSILFNNTYFKTQHNHFLLIIVDNIVYYKNVNMSTHKSMNVVAFVHNLRHRDINLTIHMTQTLLFPYSMYQLSKEEQDHIYKTLDDIAYLIENDEFTSIEDIHKYIPEGIITKLPRR